MSRGISLVLSALVAISAIRSACGDDSAARSTKHAATKACSEIAAIPSLRNSVFYPNSTQYQEATGHWVLTASEVSTCALLPNTSSDVGEILKTIGRTRSPFAVKSGGHATNPGFSSTTGVHISLTRFTDIKYDERSGTVEFGAGLRWMEVYSALEPHGVTVVGGRVPGPGVGGFTLGGGYSWLGNQRGLTLDTVTAFKLVKPNGDTVRVTQRSDPELFFGLKGGMNNFGIVTHFTLRTFSQGDVWGGPIIYTSQPEIVDAVAVAIARFSRVNTDPRAVLTGAINNQANTTTFAVSLFYDGPTPPPGVFDEFMAIPSVQSSLITQRYVSYIASFSPGDSAVRGLSFTIPVPEYSADFFRLVTDSIQTKGAELIPHGLTFIGAVVEPFLPTLLQQSKGPSAYPWRRDRLYTPFLAYAQWANASQDAAFLTALHEMRDTLTQALVNEGHVDVLNAPAYPNYALFDTPLDQVYGRNLPRLRDLKSRVDPRDVMGLAGGFKIKP